MNSTSSRIVVSRDPNAVLTLTQSEILAPVILAMVDAVVVGFRKCASLMARG